MSRRVLVTGGARGIGAGLVRRLAADGYEVHFTYNASKAPAEKLIDEIKSGKPDATLAAHGCDLSDRAAVESFAKALEKEPAYYGFVHNAGKSYDSLAAMIDVDAADSAMQVNFWSAVRLAKALMRPMMQQRAGRIVLIGSVTATRGNQGNAIYAATKAALLGYCKTLATEIARRGITVNYLAPGYVDTDMLAPYAAFREMLEKQIPAQRYAKPEDLAAVVSFLMSDGAAYVNGAEIAVDGALSASLGIKR
ncbi:MAG TPA: SDR family NAD(P)-dependent oxidoreductase [Alphaproteobacteria bacterium]|jgi:NAD(P)-dependent dehydrogenase (short-subunit alcohol dehydrogenase family)|nr:SDR family NAD(P)-dependent oxidoreductase [Alphaproteobacteria bacterium]